jgi:hypothetical protein
VLFGSLGSRSHSSDLPRLNLILSVSLGSYGLGLLDARGGREVAGARLPRRRFAGASLTWCSGLGFGRDLVREMEHDMANTSRYSRWLIRVGVMAPRGGGGTGHRRAVVGLLQGFTDHNTKRKRLREMMCCSPRRELAGGVAEGDRRRWRRWGRSGPRGKGRCRASDWGQWPR